jgi:hypothetical protein
LVGASLAFVGWALVSGWPRLAAYDWDVRPLRLTAATVLLVGVIACAGLLWGRVLRAVEPSPPGAAAVLRIWAHSNLARYIPGKIWQFVAAADLARARGLSPTTMLASLLLYVAIALLAAGVVAVAAGAVPGVPGGRVSGGLAGLVALALVHPSVISAGLRLVPRRAADVRGRAGWAEGALLRSLGALVGVAHGATFARLVDGLGGVPRGARWPVGGANAAAYLVGYLAVIAPAGLGFREASLAALLAGILGSGVGDAPSLALGAAVAIASRLWVVVADLVAGAAVLAIDRG